jgi:adenylate kinase
MRVIMLGPPGAGKGTQGDRIASRYGVPHISSGELFRDEVARQTDTGKTLQRYLDAGDLVPDDLVLSLIMDRVLAAEAEGGYVLDGFPRTVPQAQALDRLLADRRMKLDGVIELRVDDAALVDRIAGRFTCAKCGAGYHDTFKPTAVVGVCDACGSHEFTRRADDNRETVVARLEAYHRQTAPILPHYAAQGILRPVDGMADIDEVARQIDGVLPPPG